MRESRNLGIQGRKPAHTTHAIAIAALIVTAALMCFPATGAVARFETIDIPGAARTIAFDVNAGGDVVGVYNATCTGATCSAARGFLWRSDAAAPESVDVPGASMTRVFGINDRGDIVGDFKTGSTMSGFVRRAGSAEFVTVRYSEGAFTATRSDLQDIDERGNAVGSYDMPATLHGLTNTIGFVWNGESFHRVEAPFESTYSTILRGIDARGAVVGCYWTWSPAGNRMHSLSVTSGQLYTSEDFPASAMSMNWRVSARSFRVGHYVDFDKTTHGYVLDQGSFENVDFPGATYTDTRGIADDARARGAAADDHVARVLLVGSYVDRSSVTHGYRATGYIQIERDAEGTGRADSQLPADGDLSKP